MTNRRSTYVWAALVAVAMPARALAQAPTAEPPATAPPAETAAPEAPAAEVAEPEAPPETPELAEARERVARGETLYEQSNFDAALVEFLRAHELLAGHPNRFLVLYNIGRCYEQLFRYDQAMDFYARYLSEGGENAEDAAEVRAKIGVLDNLLGTLRIEANVSEYEVWVDGRHVATSVPRLMVPGGTHTIELRARGHVAEAQEAQIPSREERTLTFELEELAEEFEGAHPAILWTSTGLAAGSFVAGLALGSMALSRRNAFDDDATAGRFHLTTKSRRDDIQKLALMADVFYGAAALFTVGAVVLAFLTDFDGPSADAEAGGEDRASLRLAPVAGPGLAGLSLEGRF